MAINVKYGSKNLACGDVENQTTTMKPSNMQVESKNAMRCFCLKCLWVHKTAMVITGGKIHIRNVSPYEPSNMEEKLGNINPGSKTKEVMKEIFANFAVPNE